MQCPLRPWSSPWRHTFFTASATTALPLRAPNKDLSGLPCRGRGIGHHVVVVIAVGVALELWILRRRLDPRPRHAGVAPFVASMILGVGVKVLGAGLIVLQHRDGTDRVPAGSEAIDHRPSGLPVHAAVRKTWRRAD